MPAGELTKKKTRYPVLLIHGAAIRDTFFLRSFGGIDKALRAEGYDVSVADTDGFGTVEGNAKMLLGQIERLAEEGGGKVNVIAHSKGGLDVRFLIENLGAGDKIASLTTLCTPHRGSPIASAILKSPRWILKIIAFFIDTFYRICGDKRPDSLTVCEELKRPDSGEKSAAPIPGIYCQSFSSTYRKGARKNDFVMRIPYAFSHYFEKNSETDGLVPRDSSVFGIYRGDCLDGSISHSEIIDFMTGREKKEKVFSFYSEICRELSEMGF